MNGKKPAARPRSTTLVVRPYRGFRLKPIQQSAIQEIEKHFEAAINPICALQPGRGKTAVACEIISRFRKKGLIKILIVIRASNIDDPWKKDLARCQIPFSYIHGNDRADTFVLGNAFSVKKGTVAITSYETGLLDREKLRDMGKFDLIVFDETHTKNNAKRLTQVSIEFARLAAEHKLVLTATPVQNSKFELGLLHIFLNKPEMLADMRGETSFDKKILAIETHDAIEKRIVILCNDISVKSTRASSPLKTIQKKAIVLTVPIYGSMQAPLDKLLQPRNTAKGCRVNKRRALMFLSHPDSLYMNNTVVKNHQPCTKVDAVKAILANIPKNEKVIIFSQFVNVLNCYRKTLKDEGYGSLIITGKHSGANLEQQIAKFKNIDTFQVLLTTLQKSAEGINLENANHVIILEFWWNPQKIIQAMGRIDRLTQKKDIFVYLLCYSQNGKMLPLETEYYETMEEKIVEAKEINPQQKYLPPVHDFSNPDTFVQELQDFLVDFTKRPEASPKEIPEPEVEEVAGPNKADDSQKVEPAVKVSEVFQEMIIRKLLDELPSSPSPFDDLDLSEKFGE